jgi:hypothetical protein
MAGTKQLSKDAQATRQFPEAHGKLAHQAVAFVSIGKKPSFAESSAPVISRMLDASPAAVMPGPSIIIPMALNMNQVKLISEPTVTIPEIVSSGPGDFRIAHMNTAPAFEANTCRAKLVDFISEGVCDFRINDILSSDGYYFPLECEILDYKEEVPVDALAIAKIIKHIVAMHNTYGGYLVFGVAETIPEIEFQLVGCNGRNLDIKQLKDKLYSYTGIHLSLSLWKHVVGVRETIGLFVPKRLENEPVFFGKDGPQDQKNKPVFRKDEFYMRRGDNTEPASGDGVSFLFSARNFSYSISSLEKLVPEKKFTENNLPDRNFICPRFVGRISTIEKLWYWFADQFSYVRVLAGEGGLGKTSIAYEFAQQVCEKAPIGIQRVLWLTAKKQQFSPDNDTFVPVPWTHFDSYATLLECLCRESAVSATEISGANERLLKSFLKDALNHLPTFVIIDDMDSLSADDQRRGLELAMQLGTTKSRFLLTTRRNLTYSGDIAIELEGLMGQEYADYVTLLQERFDGPTMSDRDLENLQLTTHGSPLFTDSLYRLVRKGSPVKKASEEWRGKKGAQARAAALLVEVESLSEESKRVLLAVAILRSCSRRELSQACKYVDEILGDCLQELSSFYLISAPRIRNEPRYEVLETMYSLVIQIKDTLVLNAEKFEQEVRQLRKSGLVGKSVNETSLVGHAIAEASAFLRDGEAGEALEIIAAAQRRSKYHPDLYLMQGNCLMQSSPVKLNEARKVFRKAFDGGVRKPMLFDLWYQAELGENHPVGALSVCELAIGEDIRRNGLWERNKMIVLTRIAKDQERSGDIEAALKGLDAAADFGYAALAKMPQQEQFAVKELLFDLNESIIRVGRRYTYSAVHYLDMVKLVIKMTNRKDFRRRTLYNLVDFLDELYATKRPFGKFSSEALELKNQAKLEVIGVLRNAANVRTADGEYLADLLKQAERA